MSKTRTELVMNAIGWQGGTVHELCKVLGLDVCKFLMHVPENKSLASDYGFGCAINTNSMQYRIDVIIPNRQGDYDYWVGAARSMELVDMDVCMDHK